MEEITKCYADKIGKTPDEFDAIDKHIEAVIQTWEKERAQALTIPVVDCTSKCVCKDPCVYWDDDGTLRCSDCSEEV